MSMTSMSLWNQKQLNPENGDFTLEAYDYDAFIFAELVLPKGDIMLPAKVVARKRDADGNSVGIANANPAH